MTIIRVAGCIVFNSEKKMLLLHRNKNGKVQWETPGGKVSNEEPDEVAAVRELLEETNLAVVIEKKLGESDFFEGKQRLRYVWFQSSVKNPEELQLESGFDNYRYFSIEELFSFSKELSAGTSKFLELYFKGEITFS